MTSAGQRQVRVNSFENAIVRAHTALSQAGPVFWVAFYGIALILAIALGATLTTSAARDREITRGGKELERADRLLANQLDRHLQSFESVQRSVAAEIVSQVHTAAEFRRLVSTEGFHRFLKNKISDSNDVAGVNVFDSDGLYLNSSEKWPVPAVSLADRKYFKTLEEVASGSPTTIELVESKLSQGQTLVVARTIRSSNGEFLGVVTRSISPATLEGILSAGVLPEGSLVLLHRDGTLLARYPHVGNSVGRTFPNSPLVIQLEADGYATMRLTSPVDGEDRLASGIALDHYPLSIVATRSMTAVLADWREQTRTFVWAAGFAAMVVILMLGLIVRHLKEQHRRLDVAVNNMIQGLLLYDKSERLVVCNKRYLDMFGLSSEVVKPGCSLRDTIQHRKDCGSFEGDVDKYCDEIRGAYKSGQPTQTVVRTPSGRWMQVVNQPLKKGGWLSTIEDVTEQRLGEERNARLASYDTLTDLPNRASFHNHLREALEQRIPDQQIALLFLDTDEFKSVNDTLGHHVGDELIKSIARSLQQVMGTGEFVARLGGDEFAVVASGLKNAEEAQSLVDRIYCVIRRPHECAAHRLTVDASVGVAFAPTHGTSCEELLQNADLAMYEAKSSGRRTYRVFDPALELKAKERRLLEAELRKALDAEGIDVHYQPVLDLRTNAIVGCEALARWTHPERGFISPAEFIPVAEQTGLIEQLGEYVLRRACKEAVLWPDHVVLAVNVSPAQFRSGVFALKVVAALGDTGLPARRLELEITEAVLIGDDEVALKVLHELKAIGVRVALDDFGTGYSSLSYLRRFPFDKIKIDRSFVNGLTEQNGSSAIVRAVVALAAAHKMETTAEGVETELQRALLQQLQCGQMQGFLFSPARADLEIRRMFMADRENIVG